MRPDSGLKALPQKRFRNMAKPKELKVTLVKSKFGRLKSLKACVAGLGLRKMHQTVTVQDLSLIHISEPTRPTATSRMPSSA